MLVWTTTPWTLSSNVAAAVGPELTYVSKGATADGWTYYLAGRRNAEHTIGKDNEVLGTLKGADLRLGIQRPIRRHAWIRDAFAAAGYTHRVIEWDK